MSSKPLTPERRRTLIKLAAISIGIDLILSLGELPFIGVLPIAMSSEEIAEAIISTLIARHGLDLDFFDRLLGFLPIPGVTAVTVRVIRELFF
jgi:hypothetical protein